jgi:hypothetical protein
MIKLVLPRRIRRRESGELPGGARRMEAALYEQRELLRELSMRR